MFGNDNLIKIDDMYWTKEDVPGYEYLKKSHASEMDSIIPHLKGNDVVVQAGAHCGFVIKELEQHFNTIYTFEPDPTMFTALCLNIPNNNVFKIQGCVGDKAGLVKMEDNKAFPLSGARYVTGAGKIPMFTIDSLKLQKCDLIMLDTEGYELAALQGATLTIRKFMPLLCIERYWGDRTLGPGTEDELNTFLNHYNYKEVGRAGESDFIYRSEK